PTSGSLALLDMTAYTRRVSTILPKITPLVLKRRAAAFDNPDGQYESKYASARALAPDRLSGLVTHRRGATPRRYRSKRNPVRTFVSLPRLAGFCDFEGRGCGGTSTFFLLGGSPRQLGRAQGTGGAAPNPEGFLVACPHRPIFPQRKL